MPGEVRRSSFLHRIGERRVERCRHVRRKNFQVAQRVAQRTMVFMALQRQQIHNEIGYIGRSHAGVTVGTDFFLVRKERDLRFCAGLRRELR